MDITDKLNELYGKMANHINNMIPVDWEELYCMGEVAQEDGSNSVVFYFKEKDGEDFIRSYDIARIYNESEEMHKNWKSELRSMIVEINQCFKDYEQEPWDRLTLKLDSTGAFNIDFEYDVTTGTFGGPVEREVVWAYENFGYVFSSPYHKKLLDKHIRAGNVKSNQNKKIALDWNNPNCETTYGNTFTAYGSKLKRWEPKNKVDGKQYVQWLDDEKAADFIAKVAQEKGEGTHEVLLPPGLPNRVILTNGKEYTGTHARIIVNPDGSVKTAYPFNRLFLNR